MRACLLSFALALSACSAKVDRFTLDRVVPLGMETPDTRKACAVGESLGYALAAVPSRARPPHRALIVVEMTAGLCDEADAWEAQLTAVRAERRISSDGAEISDIRDARLSAERAHARAADRFWRAFQHTEAAFGPIGAETCPRIAANDEEVYLLGLVSGTVALLNDRASGGVVGVPLDTLGKVARGSTCLDDARWWAAPSALRAASWATIPGSGPDGVDPWALMRSAADRGDVSGVRVARALLVLIRANADHTEDVEEGIRAFAHALESVPASASHALIEEYARLVVLHQSDLLWTAARGHRTPTLGELPTDPADTPPPAGPDPFADDPFASPAP